MKNLLLLFVLCGSTYAQQMPLKVDRVEPMNWWVGMKNPVVEVLFYDADVDLGKFDVKVKYPGVTIIGTKKTENAHYLFVDLNISPAAKAGMVPLAFTRDKESYTYRYEIKNKSTEKNRILGFSSKDVIYLIMPDRFANGDKTNDSIPGMFEAAKRNMPYGRHGGDIKGVADRLDYFSDLGVTALWLNPVLENNQRTASYHGYAITDLYHVDRRFGSNDYYKQFIDKCHQSNLKVIQDMVFNHIGSEHWMMLDLPSKDWVHQYPQFTRTNYKAEIISDPYHSKDEALTMSDGWFDTSMPDLNQKNELLATYLIQNTLWWIEYAGIDGIRMDTYPYPEKQFMSRWTQVIIDEYPTFSIVGEVWMREANLVAYWQKGSANKDGYKSALPSVTDFPLYYSIMQGMNEPANWNSGLVRLYNQLGQDFIYPDANKNVIFLDNHDLSRFYTSIGGDMKKFKMGMVFLLTTRGIPQLYYGTELLMEGSENNHASLRKDFPGGWEGDTNNAFTKAGRTDRENEAFEFMKTLLNWRKATPAVQTGSLTHYTVQDNVYVYFRHNDSQIIMVVINGNTTDKVIDTARFREMMTNHVHGVEVISQEPVDDLRALTVPSQSALIIDLK